MPCRRRARAIGAARMLLRSRPAAPSIYMRARLYCASESPIGARAGDVPVRSTNSATRTRSTTRRMYMDGAAGLERNNMRAAQWLALAADKGHHPPRRCSAPVVCRRGLPKQRARGLMWLTLAKTAAQGPRTNGSATSTQGLGGGERRRPPGRVPIWARAARTRRCRKSPPPRSRMASSRLRPVPACFAVQRRAAAELRPADAARLRRVTAVGDGRFQRRPPNQTIYDARPRLRLHASAGAALGEPGAAIFALRVRGFVGDAEHSRSGRVVAVPARVEALKQPGIDMLTSTS